jgi:8-oxo-dGTP pyrophosphatase MutT (NUDIX family)
MPRSSPSRRRDGQRRTEETDLRRNQAGAGNPAEDTASAPANDAAESAAGRRRAARAKREPAAKREGGAKREPAAKREGGAKREPAAKRDGGAKREPAAKRQGGAKREMTARREGTGRREAAAKRRSGRRRRPGPWLSRVDEVSAGGLVVDLRGDVPRGALIGRTDRHGRLLWSLPKGHIEPGETAEQAAVREVAEETGIEGVIVATLGTIDFWFIADGRRIHKTVHHYLLRAVSGELSDADIEVTEVAWVPLPDISGQLAYPDERGLVHTAGRLLAESA